MPYISKALLGTLIPVIFVVTGIIGLAQGAPTEHEAELERKIERLEKQNSRLRVSYAQAQKEIAASDARSVEIKRRLEALGGASLGAGEDRLVQAVADLEVMSTRVRRLEEAAVKLSGSIVAYMRESVSEDPEMRANVESQIRELDTLLGLRHQPLRESTGSLTDAHVISIDSESGLIVVNVGSAAGLRVGMPVKLTRGERIIGEGLVCDIRKDIAGVLMQKLESKDASVRLGDTAVVKTIDQ